MRKDELIHLHGLLGAVVDELLERDAVTPADLEPYGECDVGPLSLRARRDDHERAVLLLATVLADAVRRQGDGAEGETGVEVDETGAADGDDGRADSPVDGPPESGRAADPR